MEINHAMICPVNAIPVTGYVPAGGNFALKYQFTKNIEAKNSMDRPGNCPCQEYSKDGLCDYPYKSGMSYEEIKAITPGTAGEERIRRY